MAGNFYWRNEAEAVAGAANFASMMSASPQSFGATVAQAAAFAQLNATLQGAYAVAIEPATRTSVSVSVKSEALRAMRAGAVLLARVAAATPTVSDAQLMSLGLSPRATRSPRAVPDGAPVVRVTGTSGRVVTLRIGVPGSARRGLPFGARGANVYSFVGENPPTDRRAYYFEAMTTRAKAQITFPNDVPNGATVWLSANWVGARGQLSAGSAPVSFNLPGGSVVPGAA